MRTCEHGELELWVFGPGERPDEFWWLAGPVFGDRAAQRELGGPFTDDPATTWVLAVRREDLPRDPAQIRWESPAIIREEVVTLLGLASVRVAGGLALLDHAYVRPEHRRQGVHAALLAARVQAAVEAGARRVRVHANERSFPALMRLGFLGNGRRGGYTVMEADATVLWARVENGCSLSVSY